MSLDTLGPGGLDYFPCRYESSRRVFRGPKRDLSEPFVAVFGGTDTYGKFVDRPFPDLLEDEIDVTCVNFGSPNAGIDALARDSVMEDIAQRAMATVLQISSPRNMSNRFYKVHPRRNDRFLKPSTGLQALYRDVDFSQFNFTKHMLVRLHQVSPDRFTTLVEELQRAWVSRMQEVLQTLQGPTVLLWFSDHAPGASDDRFGSDPWFVTCEMVETVKAYAAGYAQVVASEEARGAGTEGMFFSELEAPSARHVLSPLAHFEASAALAPVLRPLLA